MSTNEIEDVVMAHPKVASCAAVGIPDEKSGEAVKLFVVARDPSLSVEELKAYCKENLTGYKNSATDCAQGCITDDACG